MMSTPSHNQVGEASEVDSCNCGWGTSRRKQRWPLKNKKSPSWLINGGGLRMSLTCLLLLFCFTFTSAAGSSGGAGAALRMLPRTLDKLVEDGLPELPGPDAKTLFFGEDTNGVPIVVGTWFRYGSFTLAFAMFGTGFLMSCAAAAIYYVLFVVTEPSQQIRSNQEPTTTTYSGATWNVGRILRALQVAYDTYERFDPYSLDCQMKTICEIQEMPYLQGTLIKRITHYLVQMVQTKLENVKELRAADRIGNDPDPGRKYQQKYEGCRFSLTKLYESCMDIVGNQNHI